jgi:hypothetical protein
MLRKLATDFLAVGHLEVGEIESRRYSATHQRIGSGIADSRPEQAPRFHDRLRHLTGRKVSANRYHRVTPLRVDHMQAERRSVVEVEDFVLLNAMERRKVVAVEKARSLPKRGGNAARLTTSSDR